MRYVHYYMYIYTHQFSGILIFPSHLFAFAMPSQTTLNILIILISILAGSWHLVVKPRLEFLGYGRVIEAINNRKCQVVPELSACESAFNTLSLGSLLIHTRFARDRSPSTNWYSLPRMFHPIESCALDTCTGLPQQYRCLP
jgi:hypothetical protein